ncbi:MAG TPA: tetratricopeptide repeat protein [Blastocatellia bacterium]|nr:tetratricopeptide repeat protein [Blastocatellia bacterium]
MRKLASVFLASLCIYGISANAQVTVKYDVDRYDITARVDTSTNSAEITSVLKLTNTGNGPGRSLTLRLASNAKISSVTVNGASATFTQKPDTSASLQSFSISLPSNVAPKASVTVAVNYSYTVAESAANASIGPGDIVLLPDGGWVPVANTPVNVHGQDQAPFSLNITLPGGETPISAGIQKGSSFEDSINGEPFLIAGHYSSSKSDDGRFEAFVPKGLEQTAAPQVKRLFDEAGRISKFYEGIFGKPIVAPIRFVFSSRSGGFSGPSVVVFGENIARTDMVDASTLELLAAGMAKNYIGGQARVYERGWGFISEGLPRYLAALYFGERFGPASEREAFTRFARAYATTAASRRDMQLVAQTLGSASFYQVVPTKGPLVVRIFEHEIGRDKLLGTIKQLVTGAGPEGASFDAWLALLKQTGSPNIDGLSRQWIETLPDVDVAVGVPREEGGAYKSAVRNFGSGDVKVDVVAMTISGKAVRDTVVLNSDSRGFGTATFNTTEKLASVEVDPEKILIQTNYDNDAWLLNSDPPVQRPWDLSLFGAAVGAYTQHNYGEAETKLRQALANDQNNDLARAWLARTLAANGKGDEALKEANAALASQPPDLITIAWADYTIGQISESRGQHDAALTAFTKAAQAQADFVSTKTSRDAIVATESSSGKRSPVDSSVQQFLSQFDKAVLSGSSEQLKPLIVAANMKKLATRITVAHPTQWNTTVLRTEALDADRTAVDVKLDIVEEGKSQTGTALYYLRKNGGGWQLDKIDLFDVK